LSPSQHSAAGCFGSLLLLCLWSGLFDAIFRIKLAQRVPSVPLVVPVHSHQPGICILLQNRGTAHDQILEVAQSRHTAERSWKKLFAPHPWQRRSLDLQLYTNNTASNTIELILLRESQDALSNVWPQRPQTVHLQSIADSG